MFLFVYKYRAKTKKKQENVINHHYHTVHEHSAHHLISLFLVNRQKYKILNKSESVVTGTDQLLALRTMRWCNMLFTVGRNAGPYVQVQPSQPSPAPTAPAVVIYATVHRGSAVSPAIGSAAHRINNERPETSNGGAAAARPAASQGTSSPWQRTDGCMLSSLSSFRFRTWLCRKSYADIIIWTSILSGA